MLTLQLKEGEIIRIDLSSLELNNIILSYTYKDGKPKLSIQAPKSLGITRHLKLKCPVCGSLDVTTPTKTEIRCNSCKNWIDYIG